MDSNEEIINQYQNRKSKNWNKQDYTKSYNNDKANQYKSYKNNMNPKKMQKTRMTNHIDEYNKYLCKMYHDMKKQNCKEKCDREDLDVFYVGHRPWMTCWYPKNSKGEAIFQQDNYKTLCNYQKRRISIMLSSGCNYCIDQLTTNKSNEDDLLPLPHILLDVKKWVLSHFYLGEVSTLIIHCSVPKS